MPKTLSTKTVQITTTRRIERFDTIIPDDGGEPYVTVYFIERDLDADVKVIGRRPAGRLTVTKDQLVAGLPEIGLPSFADLYAGLSTLFHAQKDGEEAAVAAAAKAAANPPGE